jgi:transcriptional antiterminator RfaH
MEQGSLKPLRTAAPKTRSSQRFWRAVYVNSRTEKKVMNTLLEKGIEAYAPVVKTMRQWSDRKKMVEMPLLNGYVFVFVSELEHDKMLQTPGVVRFVRSEGKVALIREVEIQRLKQLVDLGYQLEANAINKVYKEGDKVKISSGALKGIEGYVTDAPDGKLIEVLLESIGQCIRVRVPKEILLSA